MISPYGINLASLVPMIAGGVLATSPLTSYLDTIVTIHRRKSSAGFSLDVCAIMLVSSICKVYFWISRRYEMSLFIQAIVMICVQLVLLKLALQHRPRQWAHGPLDRDPDTNTNKDEIKRPFDFWRWEKEQPYWIFITRFSLALGLLQLGLGWWSPYVESLGLIGPLIEAVLPLPQILTIRSRESVDGFRISLLVSWIGGDIMKLWYLCSGSADVALQMVICAFIQSMLDAYIGFQYYMYTTGKWKSTKQAQVRVSRQRAQSLKMQQQFSHFQPRASTIVENS